jgi:hypothetical protein
LKHEDRKLYDALLRQTASTLKPRDLIEWLLVRDFTINEWSARRIRAALGAAVDSFPVRSDYVNTILAKDDDDPRPLPRPTEKDLTKKRAEVGGTIFQRGRDFARLENLAAAADSRRNANLWHLQRYRESFDASTIAGVIVDGECTDVSIVPAVNEAAKAE